MAKYLFLIALSLVLLFANSASAVICSNNTDCDQCTSVRGCGWCSPTEQCLEGSMDGPNSSLCIGNAWNYGSCTPCQNFRNCEQCLDHNSDCVYCPSLNNGLGGCRPIGYAGCPGGLARTCPCNTYGVCSDCTNSATNCLWCGATGRCASLNQTCGGTVPVFNQSTGCTCNINQDCQSCMANGCDWCEEGGCSMQGTCSSPPILNCNAYCTQSAVTCTTCLELQGCAWCAGTKTCVDVVSNPCPVVTSCPVCNAATYCDLCKEVAGCVWCDDARSCEPDTNNTCVKTLQCSSYCEENQACGACNNVRGCTWCANTGSCEDIGTVTGCVSSPSCLVPIPNASSGSTPSSTPTGEGKHFDGGAFVGGMFLVIGIVVLVVGGYALYRWKTGKKMEYRQL